MLTVYSDSLYQRVRRIEEDRMDIEEIGKKKLRSSRKKISLDESKSDTEKDDDSSEDKEHCYDISKVDSERHGRLWIYGR